MAEDLRSLAADMSRAGGRVYVVSVARVAASASNVEQQARLNIRGHPRFRSYPASITHSLSATGLAAEIGPDKHKRQGALGNILEYGTAVTAPQAHLGPALEREAPRFLAAIDKMIDEALG